MTRVIANDLDDAVLKGIAKAIEDIVEERIAELEERIKQFTFTGPWSEDQKYQRGNFCSHGGAVYYCNVDVPISRPGQSNEWTLAVPRARDGRDGKDGKDFMPPPSEVRTVRSTREPTGMTINKRHG